MYFYVLRLAFYVRLIYAFAILFYFISYYPLFIIFILGGITQERVIQASVAHGTLSSPFPPRLVLHVLHVGPFPSRVSIVRVPRGCRTSISLHRVPLLFYFILSSSFFVFWFLFCFFISSFNSSIQIQSPVSTARLLSSFLPPPGQPLFPLLTSSPAAAHLDSRGRNPTSLPPAFSNLRTFQTSDCPLLFPAG